MGQTEVIIRAKDETKAAVASVQSSLKSLKSSAEGLGATFSFLGAAGGLATALGGSALLGQVTAAIKMLDDLNDAAERLGVTTEDLSALNFAGKLNGVGADEMAEALKKLSVKMKEAADGGKEAGRLFEALGVKVTDSSGRLKSADAVFSEIAESFAGIEDGAGKTALAVETFGRSGAKLVPVLNGGADGLKKMREEGEALGAVLDGKLVKQAAEFNDNLDRLKTLSTAAGNAIAADLIPVLNDLSLRFIAGAKNGGGILGGIDFIADGLVDPLKKITGLERELTNTIAERDRVKAEGRNPAGFDAEIKDLQRKIAAYKELRITQVLAESGQNYGNEGRGLTPSTAKRPAPSLGKPDGEGVRTARAQADDAVRLINSLREQIAVKEADLQTVGKLSGVEKEAAKIKYQLEAGTLKATSAQRESILASLDNLAALEKLLTEQEDYRKALEVAESVNLKNRQGMIDQIATAEKAAELFGLNAAQISVVEQARLADAIAIARENGASEEQIAYLEEELRMRGQLSDALIKGETKSQQRKDAEDAIKSLDEMGEFAKQAARNAQDAMADFFIDPTKNGIQSIAETFGQTVQKMIAQAAAAQLGKLLFGDLDKSGNVGGLAGQALDYLNGLFKFADGGIMTAAGPIPLRKYAGGGIANSPQLAMFGEGSTPEAYVPVPSGKIPVELKGGAGVNVTQNIVVNGDADPAQVKRAAASGARSVLGVINSSRRYS